ncbi:MAG: DoxX family protein [Chitinophagaceae bacterium]
MVDTDIPEKQVPSQPTWLTVLRILLGIILTWKGITFIQNIASLESTIQQTGMGVFSDNSRVVALVVTILTLLCGVFITVGLFTRASSAVQIPITIVAVVFVNMKNIERSGFELILSIVALGLLILFFIKGSGRLSADEYFRRGAALDKGRERLS